MWEERSGLCSKYNDDTEIENICMGKAYKNRANENLNMALFVNDTSNYMFVYEDLNAFINYKTI